MTDWRAGGGGRHTDKRGEELEQFNHGAPPAVARIAAAAARGRREQRRWHR